VNRPALAGIRTIRLWSSAMGGCGHDNCVIEALMQRTRRTHRNLLFLNLLLVLGILSGCASAKVSDLKNFTSDGCSLFPDGTISDRAKWCQCCLLHDIAYWRGGTEEERKRADEVLRDCVFDRSKDAVLAETMYAGVRAGGHAAFPTWFRWAYGWPYGRGYKPLIEEEQLQVREKLDDYWKKHPEGYCVEKHGTASSPGN
jgi:hypothetical protein